MKRIECLVLSLTFACASHGGGGPAPFPPDEGGTSGGSANGGNAGSGGMFTGGTAGIPSGGSAGASGVGGQATADSGGAGVGGSDGGGAAGSGAAGGAAGSGGSTADAGCVDFSACAACLTNPCVAELKACDAVSACLMAQFPQADCFKACVDGAQCWDSFEAAGGPAATTLRSCALQHCSACQP